jgi:hypothetical protein
MGWGLPSEKTVKGHRRGTPEAGAAACRDAEASGSAPRVGGGGPGAGILSGRQGRWTKNPRKARGGYPRSGPGKFRDAEDVGDAP